MVRTIASIAFVLLIAAAAVAADEPAKVTVDLTSGASQAVPVTPGATFRLILKNVIPGKDYKLTDGNEERTFTPPRPTPKTDNCTIPDEATAKQKAAALLDGKNTEEDVSGVVTTDPAGCEGDAKAKVKEALAAISTVDVGTTFKVEAGQTLQRTIMRDKRAWKLFLTAPAANDPALSALREVTSKHPELIVMRCSYRDNACAPSALFINADAISAVYITDVPIGRPLTVRVTAGEDFPEERLRYNLGAFASSPDTLLIPLHMLRSRGGVFTNTMSNQAEEARKRYGITYDSSKKPVDPRAANFNAIRIAQQAGLVDVRAVSRQLTADDPQIASVPLFVRGRSEIVTIQLDFGGEMKTFTVPLRYQRFWLDTGGFFVFTRRVDEELQFEQFDSTATKRRIHRILKDTSIEPVTGIVINVHPGNYPMWAFQFGISAEKERQASYYLGVGLRAREIGKRGLATVAVGVAMQQEDRFPFVNAGEEHDATSPLLQPKKTYGFFYPYVSISLGFSFGGVSERTNVAASVSRN